MKSRKYKITITYFDGNKTSIILDEEFVLQTIISLPRIDVKEIYEEVLENENTK